MGIQPHGITCHRLLILAPIEQSHGSSSRVEVHCMARWLPVRPRSITASHYVYLVHIKTCCRYEGLVKDGKQHGYGVLVFPNKDRWLLPLYSIQIFLARHDTHLIMYTGTRASLPTVQWMATGLTSGAALARKAPPRKHEVPHPDYICCPHCCMYGGTVLHTLTCFMLHGPENGLCSQGLPR